MGVGGVVTHPPWAIACVLAGTLVLVGCDSNGAIEELEIADVIISPDVLRP
jgi:hypothetical protein